MAIHGRLSKYTPKRTKLHYLQIFRGIKPPSIKRVALPYNYPTFSRNNLNPPRIDILDTPLIILFIEFFCCVLPQYWKFILHNAYYMNTIKKYDLFDDQRRKVIITHHQFKV